MKLTVENLEAVILDCLFKEGEDTSTHVIGNGVMTKMGFNPERLKANESNILNMLKCLPDEFMKSKGGGWSFLNACVDREGVQWTGMHSTVDKLLVLGTAINKVIYPMPRELWTALPGGVPYFVVTDN
jgi:hypothetical protein